MKVKQLIAALQKQDPEAPLFVRGYEGGINDVSRIRRVTVLRNAYVGVAWYGKHERNPHGGTKGVELWGTNK